MRFIRLLLIPTFLFLMGSTLSATTWLVGAGKTYTKPSQVMPLVNHGDTVLIDSGVYLGDVGTWTKNNLLIKGVDGFAHLKANGSHAGGKAIWVVQGNNTRIERIEFSEAAVPDKNGAGIRQEGIDLRLFNCYFHHNENGILAGDNPSSTIEINQCIFHDNGFGDGLTHNMYINRVKQFTLKYSYSYGAIVGHCVKSRAYSTTILYNRIMDEATGNSSMLLDISNGGEALVMGNVFQQGPSATNKRMVTFGAEGYTNPKKQLWFVNNTMINQRFNGTFLFVEAGADSALVLNNIMVGPGDSIVGTASFSNNFFLDGLRLTWAFCDSSVYDFGYCMEDGNISNKGLSPSFWGIPHPNGEYSHVADSVERIANGDIDLGAFEFVAISNTIPQRKAQLKIWPNPANHQIGVQVPLAYQNSEINIYNLEGKSLYHGQINSFMNLSVQDYSPGIYLLRIKKVGSPPLSKSIIISH